MELLKEDKMNRRAKKNIESVFIIGLFTLVLLSVFVFATIPDVNFDPGAGFIGVKPLNVSNTSTVEFFNVTINWTLAQHGSNITEVNITLAPNMTLAKCEDCNGTDSRQHYTFVNTSGTTSAGQVLSWRNASGELINATMVNANASFWFNATSTTAGWFNFTISILNITAAGGATINYTTGFYNLSIRVNDTTPPIVNVTPGDRVENGTLSNATSFGLRSGRNFSGNVTIRITAQEDTPVTMIFRILNATTTPAEIVNLTLTNQSADGYFYRRLNTSTYRIANVTNGTDVTYNITIWLNDTSSTGLPGSNINNTVVFSKIRFDNVPPVINASNISSPTAGGNYSQNLTFNITGYDHTGIIGFWNATNSSNMNISNATFEAPGDGFNSRAVVNFNTTSLRDGYYDFYFIANDTAGNNNISTPYSAARVSSVVIDNSVPTVTLTKNTASTTSTSLVINVAASDNWPGNVSGQCTHDQGSSGSITGSGSGTQTFTRTGLNCGNSATVQITCTDYAGNSRTSSITASTNSCAGGSGGGGGGGGGPETSTTWTATFTEDNKELSQKGDVSKSLGAKQRVKLKVDGKTKYVGVQSLTDTSATIEVMASPPQIKTLNVGQDFKVNVDDDNTNYDVYVKLNSITNDKADLTIRAINEEIPAAQQPGETGETTGTPAGTGGAGEETGVPAGGSGKIIAIVVVLLVIIGIVVFFVLKKRNQ